MHFNVENVDVREDIYSFNSVEGESPFTVMLCGVSYCDGTYSIKRDNSEVSVIEYIVSGSGVVCEDTQSFTARAGDVYFLKEGRDHYYHSDKNDPWVKIWMNFRGPLAKSISDCYGLSDKILFKSVNARALFEEIIDVGRSCKDRRAAEEMLSIIFHRIAVRLSKTAADNFKSGENGLGYALRELLDSQHSYDKTLDEIISPLYCTKSHAIREFKKIYGISPYEYLQKQRFDSAAAMLKNTAIPISDIAAKLDFYDIHYFSVSFKKRFGITPSYYRKNQ